MTLNGLHGNILFDAIFACLYVNIMLAFIQSFIEIIVTENIIKISKFRDEM
jgi:hypothetical protein